MGGFLLNHYWERPRVREYTFYLYFCQVPLLFWGQFDGCSYRYGCGKLLILPQLSGSIFFILLFLGHRHAPIYGQHLAIDIARFIGAKKGDGRSDFFGLSETACGRNF